jgi:hypothetical protein
MARKKPSAASGADFILFDVYYEDGTRLSNRRVPASMVGGLDGDDPALEALEAEDRRIGELSGRPRAKIKSIVRSGSKAAAKQAVR